MAGKRTGSTVRVKVEFLEAKAPATVPADSVGRFAAVKGMLRRPGRSGVVADGAAFVEAMAGRVQVAWIVLTALDCRCAREATVVSDGAVCASWRLDAPLPGPPCDSDA